MLRAATRKPTQADYTKNEKAWYIVDPRKSWWLSYWDLTTATALVYTATMTPFEVAYLPTDGGMATLILNRIVDVIFACDLILNFFLAFPTDSRQSGSHWVLHHYSIVRHYLTGWFLLDFGSSATSLIDIIPDGGNDEADQGRTSKLKMLRTLRILRLFKMLRLLRSMRLMKRWETRLRIDYGMLALAQSMLVVILFAHWSACLWMLQVSLRNHLSDTWLYNARYCVDSLELELSPASDLLTAQELRALAAYSAPPPEGFEGSFACLSPSSIYAASFYWSVMTARFFADD